MLAGYLAARFFRENEDATVFLPGPTTHGHYQIEMKCATCHEPWGGVGEQSCIDCHGAALKAGGDSHPQSKFTDPRNADRLQAIAADKCVTCHVEHRAEHTLAMGVTQPQDFCQHCHADVAQERPSHKGMSFTTCFSVGCHNYHDNTALYEDFMAKHAADPVTLLKALLPELTTRTEASTGGKKPPPQHDGRVTAAEDGGKIAAAWSASAHAAASVNCTACHTTGGQWQDKPGQDSCVECHKEENAGFREGLHGMRLAQGLPPMQPAMARLPMKPQAGHQALSCISCHGPHDVDTRRAAVESCLQCHNDGHSLAYKTSAHYRLWQAEISGGASPGSGVSCATCHMPREEHAVEGVAAVRVQHNQSLNLRPVEKMARGVCIRCHGLGFTFDSLAEPGLGRSNFDGPPVQHVESIDMVQSRRKPAKAR
ncbi:MAG: cytochrome c3 family protein [Prosthecobacter sp.]